MSTENYKIRQKSTFTFTDQNRLTVRVSRSRLRVRLCRWRHLHLLPVAEGRKLRNFDPLQFPNQLNQDLHTW